MSGLLSTKKYQVSVVLPLIQSQRPVLISTEDEEDNYFHHVFPNQSELIDFAHQLRDSGISVRSIQLSPEQFSDFANLLANHKSFFNLSTEHRIVCQFTFLPNDMEDQVQFSSALVLPGGGDVRLFKRTVPLLGEDFKSSVLGVQLSSQSVWMCRVATVSGPRRIDIKAGCTKADVLRVPNARGSWSDLFPVEQSLDNKLIYLVEFI